MDSIVQLIDIDKAYGKEKVVKGISLDVKSGEFLTMLGPSGCGKTTTLRMVAGFETPDHGNILIDGESVIEVPPYKRDVNTVFQSYALFPHLSAQENIEYGLKMKGVSKAERATRVKEALRLVQLETYGERKPKQLSGGQQQRVAVARALVNNPKVLLLDEPLGALDLKLRKQMQMELKHLQKQLEITFIYVTHDQEEALTMSDRIAVMNKGVIEQIATPKEIYEKPKTKFVADFIGDTNLFEVKVIAEEKTHMVVELAGEKAAGKLGDDQKRSNIMYLSIRPERMKLLLPMEEVPYSLKGIVEEVIFVGSFTKSAVRLSTGDILSVMNQSTGQSLYRPGDPVRVTWEIEDGIIIEA